MLSKYKQVLVVRKDLNMRKGKIAAQCAHGSLLALMKAAQVEHDDSASSIHIADHGVKEWLFNEQTKICVYVESEDELHSLYAKTVEDTLLPVAIVTDAGHTEFHGVPTDTVLAIGPGPSDEIDEITGHLKLL